MGNNWVERRALREKNLRSSAPDFWQEVIVAIQGCCDSFNEHYSRVAVSSYKTVNGHRLLVDIVFLNIGGDAVRRTVAFDFNRDKQHIEYSVDGRGTTTFPMDADDRGVFVVANGAPRDADDFSQIVLEKPLFDKPQALSAPPHSSKPKSSWS